MNRARIRKKLFVDPVVQGAILRRLFLHWAYAMLAGTLVLLLLSVFMNGVDRPLVYHLSSMWENYGILLIIMVCLFPAFAYDSIKLSNRFAGPIFAMRMAIKTLADGGTIPELTCRKGDFWTEMATDLNRLAARMNQCAPASDATTGDSSSVASSASETSELVEV